MLIAFGLPVIILYELGRTRIAKYFYRVASRLKVENASILLSSDPEAVDDWPVPLGQEEESSMEDS
jgi:hypothetical protein